MEGAKPHLLIKRAGGRCPSAQDQDRTLLGDTGGWEAGFPHSGSTASQYRPPSSLPALGAPRSFPKVAGAKAPLGPEPVLQVMSSAAGVGVRQVLGGSFSCPSRLLQCCRALRATQSHCDTHTLPQCSCVHAVHLGCRITDTLMPTQDAHNAGHHCARTFTHRDAHTTAFTYAQICTRGHAGTHTDTRPTGTYAPGTRTLAPPSLPLCACRACSASAPRTARPAPSPQVVGERGGNISA